MQGVDQARDLERPHDHLVAADDDVERDCAQVGLALGAAEETTRLIYGALHRVARAPAVSCRESCAAAGPSPSSAATPAGRSGTSSSAACCRLPAPPSSSR